MNLPNKLTVLRVILIPFFVVSMMIENGANQTFRYVAAAIFIIASLTDMLDGKIARKYNLVTNFGKFMDPLADKLLVCSALICLIQLGQLPAWMVIIIVCYCDYCQRIYYQWFPSGSGRAGDCDCSQLLGQI